MRSRERYGYDIVPELGGYAFDRFCALQHLWCQNIWFKVDRSRILAFAAWMEAAKRSVSGVDDDVAATRTAAIRV